MSDSTSPLLASQAGSYMVEALVFVALLFAAGFALAQGAWLASVGFVAEAVVLALAVRWLET